MKKSFEKARYRREDGREYKHDLGQHFLYDEALLSRLVDSTGLTEEECVLEIGPGTGMLTQFLARKAKRVIAVETDESLIPFLKLKMEEYPNLEVVHGDIRKQNLQELCAPLGENFFVIANIPYSITTAIFDMLWQSGLPIRQISVMIQKEVADKLMAAPSTESYGLTSVRCQYYSVPELEEVVPAELFTPPPKVDSAFIHLHMRKEPPVPVKDEKLLMRMLKSAFSLRRKTLTNALKGVVEPDKLRSAMEACGLKPTARGEELNVEKWIQLSNAVCDA